MYCFWVITTGTIICNLHWQRNKRYRFGGTKVNGLDRGFTRVTVARYHAAGVRVLYERIEMLILIAGTVLLVFCFIFRLTPGFQHKTPCMRYEQYYIVPFDATWQCLKYYTHYINLTPTKRGGTARKLGARKRIHTNTGNRRVLLLLLLPLLRKNPRQSTYLCEYPKYQPR